MIPASAYYEFYMNISLVIVMFTLLHAYILPITDGKNIAYINVIGYLLLCSLILFIGLRPISYSFVDMMTYNRIYEEYMLGNDLFTEEDVLFHYFMRFCAQYISPHSFFLLCAFLYIYPMYRVSKKLFNDYWFYSFLTLIVSFSFWSFGTNGIRNGMGTSLFLLAISFYDKKFWLIFIMLIATQIHKALWLPVLGFTFTFYYINSKHYLLLWIMSIPLSLALGSFWESLFSSFIADDKLGGYLSGGNVNNDSFKTTGFRFDFIIYSAGAVFSGWYFIFKKQFSDLLYKRLYATYLMCNAFWILIIRANFSNRFAYLSWFMMSIIIFYPFLKKEFFKNHHIKLGKILTIYFLFTFLMYYVYYGGAD